MKAKITQKGVYDAKGKPMKVGDTIEVKGNEMPAHLTGKARPLDVDDTPEAAKKPVTNPAKDA
jgi:hypothetical protein